MITKENTPVAEDYGYGSIKRVLITEEEIAQAVKKTGQLISEEYAGKPLLIIGILKGCYVFLADFCRAIKIPCEIAFMAAESYGQKLDPQAEYVIVSNETMSRKAAFKNAKDKRVLGPVQPLFFEAVKKCSPLSNNADNRVRWKVRWSVII